MQDRVPQARIYKVWGGPNYVAEDALLLELADAVLTGGKNSRLYERLVYRDQTATSVGGSLFSGEIGGYYELTATVQPGGDIEAVRQAINEELQRFLAEGPTEDEFARVTAQFKSGFVRGVEKIGGFGGKSSVLARNAVYAGDPGFYKTKLEWFEAATPETVKAAANRWLNAATYQLDVLPFPELRAAETGVAASNHSSLVL